MVVLFVFQILYTLSSFGSAKLCSSLLLLLGGACLEVVLQRCQEVADDGHTPCLSKQTLSTIAAQVGHIGVVLWEAKKPTKTNAT